MYNPAESLSTNTNHHRDCVPCSSAETADVEDFLTDNPSVPRKRPRVKPRTNKTSLGLSRKLIACPCAKHKGMPLRPDLYKRCQNQQRIRNLRQELQAPLPKHLTHIPESSQRKLRALTPPESGPVQDDYGYHDTTLPLPGQADGEGIADGDPQDYTDSVPDAKSRSRPLDGGPQSCTSSTMSPRINNRSPSGAEDEPELDEPMLAGIEGKESIEGLLGASSDR
ncbi:hypothetical protein FRC08_001703 [Ceratobasidium sp. 394]|nr:hypothetical protein FRC08_001703 [Ceratobasidium sp. 394]